MDEPSANTVRQATYRSYLLRLWREDQTGGPWRASLQSAVTGERHGFANLDSLFDFILHQTTSAPDSQSDLDTEETRNKEVTNQSIS